MNRKSARCRWLTLRATNRQMTKWQKLAAKWQRHSHQHKVQSWSWMRVCCMQALSCFLSWTMFSSSSASNSIHPLLGATSFSTQNLHILPWWNVKSSLPFDANSHSIPPPTLMIEYPSHLPIFMTFHPGYFECWSPRWRLGGGSSFPIKCCVQAASAVLKRGSQLSDEFECIFLLSTSASNSSCGTACNHACSHAELEHTFLLGTSLLSRHSSCASRCGLSPCGKTSCGGSDNVLAIAKPVCQFEEKVSQKKVSTWWHAF